MSIAHRISHGANVVVVSIQSNSSIQRSPLFCANIVKKDPGRARQNSLAAAKKTSLNLERKIKEIFVFNHQMWARGEGVKNP